MFTHRTSPTDTEFRMWTSATITSAYSPPIYSMTFKTEKRHDRNHAVSRKLIYCFIEPPPRVPLFLVRATGLEPARLSQRNLNPPSLPIPPRPHVAYNRVILSWEPGNVNGRQSEPLKFPGGKGQFSQFLLSLSLTFRQGACKIS